MKKEYKMDKENFLRVFLNYKNEFKNGNNILNFDEYDWINRDTIEKNIISVNLFLFCLCFLVFLFIMIVINGETNNIKIIFKYNLIFFTSLSFIFNLVYFIKLKKFKRSNIYSKVKEYFDFKNSIYYENVENLFNLNNEITKAVFNYDKDLIIEEYKKNSGLTGCLILKLLYKTEYSSGKENILNKINASKNIEILNNII